MRTKTGIDFSACETPMADLPATDRFSGLAGIYARCRPDYPVAAVDFLLGRCGLQAGDSVVDIGTGTGIFSRLLAQRGLVVTGIEPNADMRGQAERGTPMVEGLTRPTYREGTGERAGLPDGCAKAVVCAQAFHWLDAGAALREFHRLLEAERCVVLLWNERDESDPFTAAYGDVIRSFPNAVALESARHRAGAVLLTHPLFEEARVDVFRHTQEMSDEELPGRAFSASYAPRDPRERDEKTRELHAIFDQFACEGRVVMRYTTSVYTARRTVGAQAITIAPSSPVLGGRGTG